MSEQKKPEAKEFWENKERVQIVGTLSDGATVGETSSGSIRTFKHENGWKHLPDCGSFGWQPETFPQYWTTVDNASDPGAYVIRTSKTEFKVIDKDGTTRRHIYSWYPEDSTDRTRLTQAEAESRVKKPEPVDSPDDWVTQDRVIPRNHIDQWCWVKNRKQPVEEQWLYCPGNFDRFKHGDVDGVATLHVRCRRRDLPQETPKREYVKVWLRWGNDRLYATTTGSDDPKDRELKHDGTRFYLGDAT